MAEKTQKSTLTYKLGYIPSLDGLRSLAVLAVIAYHMNLPWAAGGLLGVTMFFVLSGYLITSLLIQEIRETDTINLPQFWLRRVRRLFPAIVVVICVTTILCGIFNHGLLTKMKPDIVSSLFFFNNWWQIFHNVSYFDAMGAPSPLAHFWSLAIEEQFYLIWPVLLLICHKLGMRRNIVRIITLILALASVIAMAVLFVPGADPSRVYYGTDTRAFSLLIGALLAFSWPAAQLHSSKKVTSIPPKISYLLDAIGILALLGVIAMLVFADGMSAFLYRGGILLCSVLTAIVIAVVVHPASRLSHIVGCAPLVWVGKRSYGMYLWHYPILLLLMPVFPGHMEPWWFLIIELVFIFVISDLSYRFVENPIRKGAIRHAVADFFENRRGGEPIPPEKRKRAIIACAAGAFMICGAIIAVAVTPEEQYDENTKRLMQMQEEAESAARQAEIEANIARTKARVAALNGDPSEWQLLLIGDSVSLGASDAFLEHFPNSIIDSAVSRYTDEFIGIYEYYIEQGWEGSAVICAVGVNGPLTREQLDRIGEAVEPGIPLFVVTGRAPHVDWQDSNNDIIRAFVADRKNTYIIDWFSYSNNSPNYFFDDDTHLETDGRFAYVALIEETIRANFPLKESAE